MSDSISHNRGCPICNKLFDSMSSMHLHCIRTHPGEYLCCPICFDMLKSDDFVRHADTKHGRKTQRSYGEMDSKHFRCAYQYPFDERMVEGPKCMDCSKTFNNITNAKAHYKYHHLVVRFVCHFCTDVSKTFQCLQHHFDAIHKPNMHTKCVRSASMSTTNVVFPKKEERPEVSHSSTGKIASTERRRMVTRSDLAVTIDRIRKRQAGRVLHSSTSNTRLIERQRLDERSDLFVTNAHTDDNSMRKRSAEKVSHPQNSNRTSLKRRKIAWKIPKNDHRFEPSSLPAHYFTRIDEEGCVRVKEDELNDLDVTITLSDDE